MVEMHYRTTLLIIPFRTVFIICLYMIIFSLTCENLNLCQDSHSSHDPNVVTVPLALLEREWQYCEQGCLKFENDRWILQESE